MNETNRDKSGCSVSLSSNGNIIIIDTEMNRGSNVFSLTMSVLIAIVVQIIESNLDKILTEKAPQVVQDLQFLFLMMDSLLQSVHGVMIPQ